MMQSKHEFFHSGVDNQKRPDIVVDLRRKNTKEISKWTPQEKEEAKIWLKSVEHVFNAFKEEILSV